MNGREVFDELRSMNPCVAVMLSSGFAEQKDVNSMLALGLRGFLPKPYTQERLLSQVRSTIVGSRSGNSAAPVTVSPTTPLVPVPAGAPETV
jgi:DNA-binding NarL/FixJ family response regulator